MKKILLIAAVAGLTMVSCKKDRVCTCTTTFPSGTTTSEKTTYFKVKKSVAAEKCVGEETDAVSPTASTGAKTTCDLK